MKKNLYLILMCLSWLFVLNANAANVVPQAGTYYNIIQTPSNMVLGSVGVQPCVQTPTNSLEQAFEFIPVEGKADTYYIKSYFGKYLNKVASSGWNMTLLTEPDPTNTLNAEWVITDDASSATVFRLLLNANSKYVATDGITNNSYTYCDKSATHERGLFTLVQATIPTDLVDAYNKLTLGDISAVTANLTLPAVSGTANIPVVWSSSLPAVIAVDGTVTRPDQYDAVVKLTATMSQVINEVTYTMTKDFNVTVKAKVEVSERLAKWDFSSALISEQDGQVKVTDASESAFVGTVMNDARIRTIGNSEKINVLDLGNGTGYFDMGAEIGKAIYALTDYTMCGYFRIAEDYTELGSNGNFYWTFSNTADAPTDKNGYIIGLLKNQSQEVTPGYWQVNNQGVYTNTAPAVGGWHHFAYVQNGTTGTVFVDGVQTATGSLTNLPATTLPISGRTGTLYNWLGRSPYPGDVYLRKTLLYDFQLLRIPLSANDLAFGVDGLDPVAETIDKLNNAYLENPDYVVPELGIETEALTLGETTNVTSNMTLPVKGTQYPTVNITWKSSHPSIISETGVVTRPDYYSFNVTLTATLTQNGQKATKAFTVTVAAKEGTAYTGDLLLKHDFKTVSDSVVTDAAEKHFAGVLKNGAKVVTMGTTTPVKVLSLGDSIGYFDMGLEIGKVMYHQTNYTIGAYYRIDNEYTGLSSPGNFLWSISNTNSANTVSTGYMFGCLKDQSISISPKYWDTAQGNQGMGFATPALQGSWHHFAYTQDGTVGTIYIDGIAQVTGEVTNTPANTLVKEGVIGTLYNWLGRSCYASDAYLRKTLVSDFRIYSKALTAAEVQTSVLNVADNIALLDLAYSEGINAVHDISASNFKVITTKGHIKVTGATNADKITVFDVAGRQLKVTNAAEISVNRGVYIVKINNYVTKVVVE